MPLISEELTQVVNEVLFKLKYDKPGKKNASDKLGNLITSKCFCNIRYVWL